MTQPNVVERARAIREKGRPSFGSALHQVELEVYNWAGEVLAAYEIGRYEEDPTPYRDALHDLVMLRAQDEIGCVPPSLSEIMDAVVEQRLAYQRAELSWTDKDVVELVLQLVRRAPPTREQWAKAWRAAEELFEP